jgi:aldose 1-epimerase
MTDDILILESGAHRLKLIPRLGGSVAAWDWKTPDGWTPLFRPWSGASEDRYTFACFPLVPWSNRITGGGFEHDGKFHPIRPNRADDPYPIHGDGWLQAWDVSEQGRDRVQLSLESHCFDGDPYDYAATQTFTLRPETLDIELKVTHLGDGTLPYGLALHPYFVRNSETRLLSRATGVWLSGKDPIPTAHSREFPPTWDYNTLSPLEGPLIDNCFTGWDGRSVIEYPDRGLALTMTMADRSGYSLMYRPPDLPFFCLEPITHPIDAFHMPDRPGLAVLSKGESLSLRTSFAVENLKQRQATSDRRS